MAKIPAHYSLVKEHANSFELHDKRDDKKFHVAKTHLDDSRMAQMSTLPKYAEGGDVDPNAFFSQMQQNNDASSAPAPTSNSNPSQLMVADNSAPTPAVDMASVLPDLSAVQVQPEVHPAQPKSQPALPQAPGPADEYSSNVATQGKALEDIGQAKSKEADQQADVYAKQAKAMQDLNADYTARRSKLDSENQGLTNQIQNSKIDPDQYLHKMSTGNKIVGAIAMALSGAGAAASGQKNLAYETIQDAINRDIDAQKAELGKKETLLSRNLQKYGDLTSATQATSLQLNAVAQGQIGSIAARSNSSQALANAQFLKSQLTNQSMEQGQKLALRATALKGMSNPDIDPSVLVPSLVTDPNERSKVFTEINQAKAASSSEQQILAEFDKASKETRPTAGGILNTVPGYTPPSVKALMLLRDPLIHDNEGRINEAEQNDFQRNIPQWGDDDSTIASKRKNIQDFINHKRDASTARGYGIDLSKYSATRGLTQSPQVQTMNGIPYRKVPGGWAPVGKGG